MRQVVEFFVGIIVSAAFGGIFLYALITPDPMQVEIGRRAHARQECSAGRGCP